MWSSCGNNDTNSKMLLRKEETTSDNYVYL